MKTLSSEIMDEPDREPQPSSTIPRPVQNLFNKGFAAFERGNLDVAVDLLLRCVSAAPGFLRARKFLRAAQIQRTQKTGAATFFSVPLVALRGIPLRTKIQAQHKTGRTADALINAERLLNINPLHRPFVLLFSEVAVAAGQEEAALLTLEAAREHQPQDPELARNLGKLYDRLGNYKAAKGCYEVLLHKLPHDPEALKLLKDAMARETMGTGWDKVDGTEDVSARDLAKDQDQTRLLDLKNKAVKSADDVETLIEEARAKLAENPTNLNYYRALARLLVQANAFEEAARVLESAREIQSADPEIDRALAQVRRQDFDFRIQNLRSAGRQDDAVALEHERDQFVFDDLFARAERYPNDLRLRYELGFQYFNNGYIDEAIQQFQLSQRSPKDRVDSLYHLALCFQSKQQLDMAVLQLEQALEVLPSMDEQKKQVLYLLAELMETTGNREKAMALFKEIYRVDIGFRDITTKIEAFYAAQRSGPDPEAS